MCIEDRLITVEWTTLNYYSLTLFQARELLAACSIDLIHMAADRLDQAIRDHRRQSVERNQSARERDPLESGWSNFFNIRMQE